jgi:hypothetical protein
LTITTFGEKIRVREGQTMKDDRNYHQRLQEFCDCYMETDPKQELEKASRGISGDPQGDLDELALKFLGLGIFYGASEKAKKVTLRRSSDGAVGFTVDKKGKYELPPPKAELADRVISIARAITHVDTDTGALPVAMGLRNERLDLTFQFERKGGAESLSISFPEL